MPTALLIKNVQLVNEGQVLEKDILIRGDRIEKIANDISIDAPTLDAQNRFLLPGLIDDQVHFREPGLTHKADLQSESRAAVAGGVTSFMDMPNVIPATLTATRIAEKKQAAAGRVAANYAFYLGAANDNLDDIAAIPPHLIAGIKIFMGASTGNLLVDDESTLLKIFACAPCLIATHCENSRAIAAHWQRLKQQWGDDLPADAHAQIRARQFCLQSSTLAVDLARQTGARLHILHITTADELSLLTAGGGDKQITAEACVHHLLFDDSDYPRLGMRLKCNPAVKSKNDRQALRQAVVDGRIDVIATDHAPHLAAEKDLPYEAAAAGLPLVEHALPGFLECVADGDWQITDIARAGAHRVAEIFNIIDRGYIREGYFADLVLVESLEAARPQPRPPLSKCGWSPFQESPLRHRVWKTLVNGTIAYEDNAPTSFTGGKPLEFNR